MILRGRTGNNMFQIAALLTFCWRTGHRPVLTDSFRLQRLLSAFPVVQGMLELGPMPRNAVTLTERGAYIFDVECSHRMHANKSVIIDGYFQSWKYLQGYEDAIGKVFTLDESYVTEAKHMLLNISTQVASSRRTSAGQITIVAIHVRRGDIALARGVYQVGSLTYLQRAMDYFRGRYTEVQFVVCSDTAFWSEGKLRGDDIHTRMSTRHWALDMALLVLADHVILTVGSFGWWGAWLGRGQREVIYYDQPFRQDSVKAAEFRAADFYPSSWKPMGDWCDKVSSCFCICNLITNTAPYNNVKFICFGQNNLYNRSACKFLRHY